jgi:hypothetical protein
VRVTKSAALRLTWTMPASTLHPATLSTCARRLTTHIHDALRDVARVHADASDCVIHLFTPLQVRLKVLSLTRVDSTGVSHTLIHAAGVCPHHVPLGLLNGHGEQLSDEALATDIIPGAVLRI